MLVFSFAYIYNFYRECDIYERADKQFKICMEICKKSKKVFSLMVLNNGIIEDIGTHEYLIKNNKTYKNLYKTEFNKESSKENR